MDYHIAPAELGILEDSTNVILTNKIHANHCMAVMDSVSNCKYLFYDRSPLARWTPEGGANCIILGISQSRSDRTKPLCQAGREMPNFLMRASSVVGFKPRIDAAPFFPLTRQPVCSRVFRMWLLSSSESVLPIADSSGSPEYFGSMAFRSFK